MIEDTKQLLGDFRSSLTLGRFLILLLLVVPVVVLVIYAFLIATDRYESHASVYITEEQTQTNPLDLSLFGVTGAGSSRDILVLKTYIDSQGMMLQLDKELGLLKHFESHDADFFSRLGEGAPVEDAYNYYLARIQTEFNDEAQLLEISVQTFDADFSKKVLDAILVYSQTFIDKLNENIQSSQLSFFDTAVKDSENDLIAVRQKLANFQRENAIYSTELASQTISQTISKLEQEMAQKQAELRSRLGVLSENAPTVQRIKAEIDALGQQIKNETERLASKDGTSISQLDSIFREIQLEIEYKTLRYKSHLQSYEQAYIDTGRRLRFLTVVEQPTVAESSLYPQRLYIIVTGSIIALAMYFIVSISIAVIREHA
ncbi:hypothetical protein [uncultured Cohaesibacter sp.]|uniref:hypothetical protein n=1 Tax=uncultured Cohaesibacter sp. TaxID=1002546 RepID=UPI0029C64C01|nr:hypothetical protein [uncultured Cohaesibacter sp.]